MLDYIITFFFIVIVIALGGAVGFGLYKFGLNYIRERITQETRRKLLERERRLEKEREYQEAKERKKEYERERENRLRRNQYQSPDPWDFSNPWPFTEAINPNRLAQQSFAPTKRMEDELLAQYKDEVERHRQLVEEAMRNESSHATATPSPTLQDNSEDLREATISQGRELRLQEKIHELLQQEAEELQSQRQGRNSDDSDEGTAGESE